MISDNQKPVNSGFEAKSEPHQILDGIELNNKTAIVTGGYSGIGLETTRALKGAGVRVITPVRRIDIASKALDGIVPAEDIIEMDLGDLSSVQKFVDDFNDLNLSLDLLINNASTFYPTPIDDISEEHWKKLVGSNLKGPLFLIQGLKQKLKESKGSIINITDTNLSKGVANYSIYSAAKAGLESITKGLARELAPEIKVNAIAPGAMLEPPDVTWTEEQKSKVIESIPLKRMGSEKDIAEAVKFLAQSQYITGQIIKVDGGRSL